MIREIKKTLDTYANNHQKYPSTQEGLKPLKKYFKGNYESLLETNPWGGSTRYSSTGNSYSFEAVFEGRKNFFIKGSLLKVSQTTKYKTTSDIMLDDIKMSSPIMIPVEKCEVEGVRDQLIKMTCKLQHETAWILFGTSKKKAKQYKSNGKFDFRCKYKRIQSGSMGEKFVYCGIE